MTDLDPRVQVLIDKDDIRDVIYRFARAMDRNDWELAKTCYHDGAIDDHGVFAGDAAKYVAWVSENLPKLAEVTMHFVGNSLIEVQGETASAESYTVGYHRYTRPDGTRADFLGGARYVDHLAKRAGLWKIVHRLLVWDWVRDDAVTTEWEGFGIDPTAFAFGKRDRSDPVYTHGRTISPPAVTSPNAVIPDEGA